MRDKQYVIKMPMVISSLHTISVVVIAIVVAQSSSPEIGMIWLLFMIVDFPLGWLSIPITLYLQPIFRDSNVGGISVMDVWLPAILFGLLGGLQYYCLTCFVSKVWNRMKSKNRAP